MEKPNFTDKTLKDERTTSLGDGKNITGKSEPGKHCNNFFESIKKVHDLERPEISQECNNPVENVIRTFEKHHNNVKIKSNISATFAFF